MQRLTVLYDAQCSLCREVHWWLQRQPRLVDLEFVSARSDELLRRYPSLDPARLVKELTVIGDDRLIYRGGKAFVMCLWALRDYRGWALRLGTPHMLPLAERYFRWFSRHRSRFGLLARFFRGDTP